ncbi:MAG: hypothetical protein NTW87_21700 [Planctomycetota bacterium]|nr:hypothetical protein [Planctomycetota bacterium]
MPHPSVSDEEVARLRAAGIAVPESLEDVRRLLREAERDKRAIPLDKAFGQIRARFGAKYRTR